MYIHTHTYVHAHVHLQMSTPNCTTRVGIPHNHYVQGTWILHPHIFYLPLFHLLCLGRRKASCMSQRLGPASQPPLLLANTTTCMQKSEKQMDSLKSLPLSLTAVQLLLLITTMPWSLRQVCLGQMVWQLQRKPQTDHNLLRLPSISMQVSLRMVAQNHRVVHLILCPRLTTGLHHLNHLPSVVRFTYVAHLCVRTLCTRGCNQPTHLSVL